MSRKEMKTWNGVFADSLCKLLMAVYNDDAFSGVAVGGMNIMACMALVSSLCDEGGMGLKELMQLFGVADVQDIGRLYTSILKDASLATAALFDSNALVEKAALESVENTYESQVIVFENPAEALCKLNEFVNRKLELDKDIFTKEFGSDLLAILVSTSLVKVEWAYTMDRATIQFMDRDVKAAEFTYKGSQQIGAYQDDTIQMCLLPCKPGAHGEQRYMLVAKNRHATIGAANDESKALVLKVIEHFNRFAKNGYEATLKKHSVHLKLPNVDMVMPDPKSLNAAFKGLGVEAIFNPNTHPMQGKVSFQGDDDLLDDLRDFVAPYISDIAHSCSVSFDEKGAVAKAVTAATIYRSMSAVREPEPLEMLCDGIFVTVICKKVDGALLPEFVCPILDHTHLVSA